MRRLQSVLVNLMLLSCSVIVVNASPRPQDVYLHEGFDTPGILPTGWIVTHVSGTTSTWSIVGTGTNPPIPPYAGAGQAKFNSYDASPNHQSRLTSPGVNLSASTDPFLSLWMYHDDEFLSSLDSVYVEATTGDSIAGPWTTIAGYQRARTITGWKQERISLLQFIGANRFYISLRGVSKYGNNMYIDDVRIADTSFHDIGAVSLLPFAGTLDAPSLSTNEPRLVIENTKIHQDGKEVGAVPTMIPRSSPMTFGAVVQNFGTFSETSYQVKWQIDGQNQTAVNNPRALARSARDTLTLSWTTPRPGLHVITAWTVLASDSNRTNDTVRFAVTVLDSSIVFSEMFNGPSFPPSGWTAVNRDGGLLSPWFQGSPTSIFLAYEGTGFAANNFQRGNGTYIDDYMISPPIPGIGQAGRVDSLKFWVRSAFNAPPATNYPDSLMILLSTTGADTSNFSIVLDYFSVPKTGWTMKGYRLTGSVPTNSTVRVAFRYLHYNGGALGLNSDFVGLDFVHVTRNLPSRVVESGTQLTSFTLDQNYPNPFNPTTSIRFAVQHPGNTTLHVYNILGQRIATLFSDLAEPGTTYKVCFDGSAFASGIYHYKLAGGATSESRKMILVR